MVAPRARMCVALKQLGIWDHGNAFILHHYAGTLEQMLFGSNDDRHSHGTSYLIQRYHKDKEKKHQEMSPVVIKEWISDIIKIFGLNEAQRLLEHVGKPRGSCLV